MSKLALPPRRRLPQQDHLPTRSCCKAPWGWGCPRPAPVARALRVALEASDPAVSFPMSLGLGSPAGPVVPAVGELEGLETCKELAELSFLVVDPVVGREAGEVVLGAEEAAVVAASD